RNEEKLELDHGASASTSAYQSFSQSFPLSYPVQAKQLRKDFDGDELIVTVPKMPEYANRPVKTLPKPERAKLDRPRFPENLPLAKNDAKDPATDDDVPETGAHVGDTRRRTRPLA